MKKVLIIISMTFLLIATAGYMLSDLITVQGKESGMQQGAKVESSPVDLKQAPASIQKWVQKNRAVEGTFVKTAGDRTYILVTWGEKRTGGYVVKIDSIVQKGNRIEVVVDYQKPKGMAIQVLTYPYDLVSIPATADKIVFIKK